MGTSVNNMSEAWGVYACRSCMLLAFRSFCLDPAQIWYSAVITVAATPINMPLILLIICESVTVAMKMPKHTTKTDAMILGPGRRLNMRNSMAMTVGATAIFITCSYPHTRMHEAT